MSQTAARYCPISLERLDFEQEYSPAGLRRIHPRLTRLLPLDLSNEEQLRQARLRADKMSIQGVQPKLSAVVNLAESRFDIVDCDGRFILKPNPIPFEEVPANEALTMSMAATAGIEVPPHGLVADIDGKWVYWIRRFDRAVTNRKAHLEDFAQLSGANRDTKYDSSLEKVAEILDLHCSFPAVEKAKLAKRLLFCFLTGNEDMHLKNFSLWVKDGIVALSPAYDLLNTTLVFENASEESALPLAGKKRTLTLELWLDYYLVERLGLAANLIADTLNALAAAAKWPRLIERSHLSEKRKTAYLKLLGQRLQRLGLAGVADRP